MMVRSKTCSICRTRSRRPVGIIEPSLRRAEIERARRKRPENLDAYDLYLRALPHFHSVMPEDADTGMDLLTRPQARSRYAPLMR